MGGNGSGRPRYFWGPLKAILIKFPISSDWFNLAKRICNYRELAFSEFVRQCVMAEVLRYKEKMWRCDCVNKNGKVTLNFKGTHQCSLCKRYKNIATERLYNKHR